MEVDLLSRRVSNIKRDAFDHGRRIFVRLFDRGQQAVDSLERLVIDGSLVSVITTKNIRMGLLVKCSQ